MVDIYGFCTVSGYHDVDFAMAFNDWNSVWRTIINLCSWNNN